MALRCALALALLAGCFIKPGAPSETGTGSDSGIDGTGSDVMIDAPPAAWLQTHNRRRRITLTRPADPPGALADFPVSIYIDDDDDLRDHPQTEYEMVFTDDSGVMPLEHEIRRYAKTMGMLEAWVRVPSLPVGTTDIYLYYDGPSVLNQLPELVWSGSYGVWHMDELGEEKDVTGQVGTLDAPAGNLPSRSAGIVGLERDYDGLDYLCVTQANVVPVEARSFSFSAWVELSGVTNDDNSPLFRGGDDNASGFMLELASSPWLARVSDGGTTAIVSLGAASSSKTYLAVAVDQIANEVRTYVNGAPQQTASVPTLGAISAANELCIGSIYDPFIGSIDEVRVWGAAHPVAWFATEHENLTNRGMFHRFADEEVR